MLARDDKDSLKRTPLYDLHVSLGGKMVPFAGYDMPVQYEGIMAEHLWVRENAGLFDVSHMGQILAHGTQVDSALETLLPGDLKLLSDMKLRYSLEAPGQPPKTGEDLLSDPDYERGLSQRRDSVRLYFEKRMLDEWFVKTFVKKS